MSDTLAVLLGDEPAGTRTRSDSGLLGFTYDAAYQARRDATPLPVSMPLRVRTHPHPTIEPWLQNLLPDNAAVIDRYATSAS